MIVSTEQGRAQGILDFVKLNEGNHSLDHLDAKEVMLLDSKQSRSEELSVALSGTAQGWRW